MHNWQASTLTRCMAHNTYGTQHVQHTPRTALPPLHRHDRNHFTKCTCTATLTMLLRGRRAGSVHNHHRAVVRVHHRVPRLLRGLHPNVASNEAIGRSHTGVTCVDLAPLSASLPLSQGPAPTTEASMSAGGCQCFCKSMRSLADKEGVQRLKLHNNHLGGGGVDSRPRTWRAAGELNDNENRVTCDERWPTLLECQQAVPPMPTR